MASGSSSGSGNEKESTDDRSVGRHAVARWLAAGAVALAGCIYFFLASHDQSVCHHETFVAVQLGGHVNTECGPPGIVNLLPFGLIIGLLFWPDLAELGIGGVTLKRRVEAQEERQAGLEASVADIRQTLTQVSVQAQAQSLRAELSTTINIPPSAPDQEALHESIAEKAPRIEQMQAAPAGAQIGAPDWQGLLGAFVQEYSRLEPYLFVPGMQHFARALDELDAERQDLVVWWNELFAEEITVLRQTRNLVVHKPERVSAETLELVLQNTRELARVLFDRLENRAKEDPEEDPPEEQ